MKWAAAAALCAALMGAANLSAQAAQPAAPVVAAPSGPVMTPEQTLLEADRVLAALAQQKGIAAALSDTADKTDGFVIDKSGVFQGTAIATGLAPLAAAGPVFWQADKVFVSHGADFGLTSGNYVQVLKGVEAGQGRYVATWRKDAGGAWRVLSYVNAPKARAVSVVRRRVLR